MSAHKKIVIFSAFALAVLAATATTTHAQGRYHGGATRVGVVRGTYYYPGAVFYADAGYGYQYPAPYGYGYGYPPPYVYYGYPDASVRLEVTPREAEVYLDGYYAGVVNDFDGTFQRLRVEPGQHEIEIYLEGHRPFRQKVYLAADRTFRIRQALQPLGPGEQPEPRPQPVQQPQMQGGQGGGPSQPPTPQPRQQPQHAPTGRRTPPPASPDSAPTERNEARSDYGRLNIRVQPVDAEVSIDGAAWRGSAGQDGLTIDIAEGSHTVEVRKPGFRTYVTQVEIHRGQATDLNVSLRND